MAEGSGQDRFLTVYGRVPVLEALRDDRVRIERVLLDRTARGRPADEIVREAARRGVKVQRVTPEKVTRISGNGRHDQGVVAEVLAPGLEELTDWLGRSAPGTAASLLVLDGITNPGNVGMIIRTCTAAGLDGVVLPRAGSPDVGPLVVKASAGVALEAPILRCPTAGQGVDALLGAGFEVLGLAGAGGAPLYETELPDRGAYVLGNETEGVSDPVARRVQQWLSIPLFGGVESLNVATAAAVLAYDLVRRRS